MLMMLTKFAGSIAAMIFPFLLVLSTLKYEYGIGSAVVTTSLLALFGAFLLSALVTGLLDLIWSK